MYLPGTRFLHIFLISFFLIALKGQSQTVFSTSATATVPNRAGQAPIELSNPITVSGLPASLNGTSLGLFQVTLNVSASVYSQLELYLLAPDGTLIQLLDGENNTDNVNASFNLRWDWALPWIRTFNNTGPVQPAYRSDANLNAVNNGQNPNGEWKLMGRIVQVFQQGSNSVNGWSISFSNFGISPAQPYSTCSTALPLRNNNITGDSLRATNQEHGSNIETLGIMGSCYNNNFSGKRYPVTIAWFKFIPYCTNDIVRIQAIGKAYTSVGQGNCGSINSIRCQTINPGNTYEYRFGSGGLPSLTPGQTYYLMIEGDNSIADLFNIWWIPGDCGIQPVNLVFQKGTYLPENRSILLNWKTSWEINSKGFHIQYRPAGSDLPFTQAGFISSYNYSQGASYTFSFPVSEENLYEVMLVQEDLDGTTEKFEPVYIQADFSITETVKISVVNKDISAAVYLNSASDIQYFFTDIKGTVLASGNIPGKKAWNEFSIPSPAGGMYLLRIRTESSLVTEKVIIP